MRVGEVDFSVFNRAPWRDELMDAAADYLRRSREELTEQEEWALLNAAMLGHPHIGLFVATDDDGKFLGFAVLRAVAGGELTGHYAQVWQVYVVPGRARLHDLYPRAIALFRVWARQRGCRRFVVMVRRYSLAYDRLLRRLGFRPYEMTYQMPVEEVH